MKIFLPERLEEFVDPPFMPAKKTAARKSHKSFGEPLSENAPNLRGSVDASEYEIHAHQDAVSAIYTADILN